MGRVEGEQRIDGWLHVISVSGSEDPVELFVQGRTGHSCTPDLR